jgi:hypothetical protein
MKKFIIILIIGAIGFLYWVSQRAAPAPQEGQKIEIGGTDIESAELTAVGGFEGVGVAARTWDGTTFAHSINADIDAPAPGTFYEGWLVMPDPFELISTGKLEPNAVGYGLSYTVDRDMRGYTDVVVTQEKEANGLDGIPETHVLEGSF